MSTKLLGVSEKGAWPRDLAVLAKINSKFFVESVDEVGTSSGCVSFFSRIFRVGLASLPATRRGFAAAIFSFFFERVFQIVVFPEIRI
jgi:hypothetical protein